MKKILSCLLTLGLFSASSSKAQNWTQIGSLEAIQGQFDDHGQQVHFVILRIDLAKNPVQVIDTYDLLHRGNAYSAFSISEVKKATKARAVINAGSTRSFSTPDPVGLLEIKGRIVSRENRAASNAGVLCLTRTSASILSVPTPTNATCLYAVQRGPLLGPDLQYPQSYVRDKYTRSAAAVDDKGRLILFATADPISLLSMSYFLYRSNLNLSIQRVLNFDGGPSSGFILSSEHPGIATTVGNTDALVASALAVY